MCLKYIKYSEKKDIQDRGNFVLTDQNHNSMSLLYDANVDLFFRDENDTHAILLLRKKIPNMEELLDSQVECKKIKINLTKKINIIAIKLSEVNTSNQQRNNQHLKKMEDYILKKKPGLTVDFF